MIEVKDLHACIGAVKLLTQIDLQARLGAVTVVMGQNGAGKSTLLKCLTGSLATSQGEVLIRNKAMSQYSLAELARIRAVVLQNLQLSFPFSALEVVKMGRNPHASGEIKDNEIATKALRTLHVEHLQHRSFPTLSGGEKQRVQIARALAQIWDVEDGILFLDEPTSALDLKHQIQILRLIKDLAKTKGFTVVCILHDINQALHVADRIYFLKAGQMVASGTPNGLDIAALLQTVFDIEPSDLSSLPFTMSL